MHVWFVIKLLDSIIGGVRAHEIRHLAAGGWDGSWGGRGERGWGEGHGKTNQRCHLISLTNTIGGDASPPRLRCTNWIPCPIGAPPPPPPPRCRPAIMSRAQVKVQAEPTDCSGRREGKREEALRRRLLHFSYWTERWGPLRCGGVQSCFTSR